MSAADTSDSGVAVPGIPGRIPYWITTLGVRFLVGACLRVRVEGLANLDDGPAILCFNHQSWADPFVLVAALPARPDLMLFGPKEVDMRVGWRNRLINWTGRAVPFNPQKTNVREAVRLVHAILARGARLGVAPEGRIHVGERVVLPIDDGVAFFALRTGVPIVPVGINGVGWIRWGGRVRVRIGAPIRPDGRPTRLATAGLTADVMRAMKDLVSDARDREPPGRVGRWFTELFNEWPEGARPSGPQE